MSATYRKLCRPSLTAGRLTPLAFALRLALASLVLGGSAHAQAQAAAQKLQYEVPAGPLAEALNRFAQQSGVAIAIDARMVKGLRSPGLNGRYEVEEGFSILLRGSGFAAGKTAAGFTLVPLAVSAPASGSAATALPEVQVNSATESYAPASLKRRSSSGALGSRSLLDTPFSITSVTSGELEDRLVTNLEQALRFDASTQATGSEYGQSASISVRGLGLDTSNGFKVDGLPITVWGNTMPIEPFERVELLKGLSGFMHGFGSPGGIVNYILKRPTEETTASVSMGYKADSLFSQALDAGGRLGEDKRFGYRVNLAREEGDTYINDGRLERSTASVALDTRLTKNLTATFDVIWSHRRSEGNNFWGVSLSRIQAIPGTVDPAIATQPNGSYYESEDRVVTAGLAWRITPDWKASLTYRNARKDTDYNYSTLYLGNLQGDYTADQAGYRFRQGQEQVQAMAEGSVQTGSLAHKLTFGASQQEYLGYSSSHSTWTANVGSGNIYRDSTLSITGSAADYPIYKSASIVQNSVFASDTLSFNERWSLIAGLRYNGFEQLGYNALGATSSSYKREPLTPTLAVMYKPGADSTLYASAVESLEMGGSAGVTNANYGETMDPVTSKQYELGYKIDKAGWGGSVAVFRLDRTAEYTNAANYYVQDGLTRYDGLDLAGHLRVHHDLLLSAGLMLLDASYVESAAALEGKRTTGTPNFQAALRAEYFVPGVPDLKLSLGAKHVGTSMMNTANTYKLPSYNVFDTGASYSTRFAGYDLRLTAVIENLVNKKYWVYNGANYAVPGAPRTLNLSAKVAF